MIVRFALALGLAVIVAGAPIAEIFTAQGSHYDVFLAYGTKYKTQINAFVASYDVLNTILIPFYKTPAGAEAVASLVATATAVFPDYCDELRGISDGAEVPLDLIMLLSFEDELTTIVEEPGQTSCSDLHMNIAGGATILAHNEDDEVYIEGGAVILEATIFRNDRHSEYSFIAYQYPGFLPGIAFGFNSHGIALTCNAVFPTAANASGLGNQYIARHILGSTNLEDAFSRARMGAACDGHSLNIMSFRHEDAKKPILTNIELSMNGTETLTITPGLNVPELVESGVFFHANMYRHSPEVSQYVDVSSVARLAVFNSMPTPTTLEDALAVLGSQANASYPIYRTGTAPDCCTETGPSCCATVASAIFDLAAKTMSVYFENPATSTPTYVYPIHVRN
eukprot:a335_39.p1 GENE.a335_39~~a335_39.p1  ORF type:complete len:410 (+),score=118.39 a335_39:45-1232(+)